LLVDSNAAMERINERIVAPLAPRERKLFIALLAKVAAPADKAALPVKRR
jgi:hypothetical protein